MSRALGVTARAAGGLRAIGSWLREKVGHVGYVRPELRLADETWNSIQVARAELSEFNQSTEAVFLSVGGGLREIQAIARRVSAQMAEVAGQGRNHDASIASLDRVLSASVEDGAGRQIINCVRGLRRDAKALGATIEAFGPILHTFDVLAVMTRIESARFVDIEGSFAGLAASVLELSQQIREQVSSSATSVAAMLRTVSAAASEAAAVAAQREENLAPLMEQTGASLRQLREHRSEIATANAHLSTQFEGISASVGDLVTALQSQDIVRQQLEHVQQALLVFNGDHAAEKPLAAIARLQAAQVDNARSVFEASILQVRKSLLRIEKNVTAVALEATGLLGTSEEGKARFFESAQRSLSSTVELLGSNREAERRLAATASTVRQSVNEIVAAISGVRAVGLMMQRIALNSTIQAARLGKAGASMEIVANAIQDLALQAEQASEKTEKLLEGISRGTNFLESTAESFGQTEEAMARLRQDGMAFEEAQAFAERGYRQSMEFVGELKERLADSIQKLDTREVRIAILHSVSNVLRSVAETGAAEPGDVQVIPGHYTMESERSVHSALADGRMLKDTEQESAIEDNKADENVEFF